MPYIYFFESEIMKPILGFLLIICLVGCGKDTPTGPSEEITKGPEGQTLEVNTEEKWSNGNIKVEFQYYRDEEGKVVKHGYYKVYYEDGQLGMEVNYKDGKEDGRWVEYYENGKIRWEENYKDGLLDGKWVWYYENAQIKSEGNYKNGELDGKWVRYDEEGNITSERCYDMGEHVACP